MIRINLLGVPKRKRGRGPAVSMAGEGPNPLLVALVVLVIAAVLNLGWWYKLNRDANRIAEDTRKAQVENTRLALVKTKFEERDRQRQTFQKRLEVIGKLQQQQSGPANLLTTIGNTVNATDAVWLTKMNDEGNNINLEGTALSIHAVANLMANLMRTGYFKNVEIKESYQDDTIKDMQAFVFTLICEKQKT